MKVTNNIGQPKNMESYCNNHTDYSFKYIHYLEQGSHLY